MKKTPLSADGHALHVGKDRKVKRRAAANLGSKGGKQRAKRLTKAELSAIGRKGGLARHGISDAAS